jgi:hypothetical protein
MFNNPLLPFPSLPLEAAATESRKPAGKRNARYCNQFFETQARLPIDEQLNESACLWSFGLETSLDPTPGLN